ncbi:MAG: phosphoesterase [Gammaproteobacteria bacterium]|nr:MAG: phosphoesterase [Gammaproteobacteria bacterium]
MNDYLTTIQTWLESNPEWLGTAIFLIALVESFAIAGILVPGVALLFIAATLAGTGTLSLQNALTCAFFGAIIGDGASYLIGRYFKQRIPSLWPFNRYPQALVMGETFFNRHGGKSVVLGRFIGPVRPVVPLIAGMLDMGKTRYFTFNLLSAVAWAPFYILPGYMVGASVQSDIQLPPHFWWVLGVSAGILCFLYWLFIYTHNSFSDKNRLYLRIQNAMLKYHQSHRAWRLFSNGRPLQQEGEFPLNSLVLGAGALALFIMLAILTSSGLLNTINQQAAQFVANTRLAIGDPLFVFITLLADPAVFCSGFLISTAIFSFKGHYSAAIHLACSGLAVAFVTQGLKDLFDTPRPDLVLIPPNSYAFPSSHTSSATVFFCLIASFIAQELPVSKRRTVYLAFSVPILLIAISRLYLEVHWLTDVFGGLFLGLCIAGVTRFSFSRYDREPITLDIFIIAGAALFVLLSILYAASNHEKAMQRYQEIPIRQQTFTPVSAYSGIKMQTLSNVANRQVSD